nr:fibroblast growth factor 1-like [Pocillopora verrucosa]
MSSFPFMVVLSIVCVITLFPSNVPSHDLGNERRSNETKPSFRQSSPLLPRFHKHRIKNNKPAVYTKEASPITLTQRPTNSRRIRLFGRVGLFLHCNANGTVSGSLNRHSSYVKFELQSFGPSIVRIRSIGTGKFFAINSKGILHTIGEATDECLFYQNHEENLFLSFASFKYYMKEHYDMFISIKRNGEVKQATSTLPGQDSIQFIALNSDSLRLARLHN